MSLQFLGVGDHAVELEKVITLFAFFNPVNIGEQLFSNDAGDVNLTISPMSIFKDDGHWKHWLVKRRHRDLYARHCQQPGADQGHHRDVEVMYNRALAGKEGTGTFDALLRL
jgi:hypothetical protein